MLLTAAALGVMCWTLAACGSVWIWTVSVTRGTYPQGETSVPSIRVSASLAAGATANPIQGNQYEYLPFPARVQFAIAGATAGLLATVFSGSDVLQQSGPTNVKAAGTLQYPFDYLLDDVAGQGERLNVQISNPTGGAIVYDLAVMITPL